MARNKRYVLISLMLASTLLASCDLNFVPDKEVNEDTIRAFYNSGVTFAYLEAAQRLLAAIDGAPVQGVTLTTVGNRVDAVVGMDFDGDGARETQVSGDVQFPNSNMSFADAPAVRITGVAGANVDGSLNATATMTGTSTVAVDGTGEFVGDSDIPVDVDMNLSVSTATGNIIGTVDIDAGETSATAFYEDNGFGGFRVRVVGDDFEFVVGY